MLFRYTPGVHTCLLLKLYTFCVSIFLRYTPVLQWSAAKEIHFMSVFSICYTPVVQRSAAKRINFLGVFFFWYTPGLH